MKTQMLNNELKEELKTLHLDIYEFCETLEYICETLDYTETHLNLSSVLLSLNKLSNALKEKTTDAFNKLNL